MYKRNLNVMATVLSLLVFAFIGLASAQTQQRPERDVLGGLKRALQEAGAPALNAQQEEQLKALVTQQMEARKNHQPDPAVTAARTAYDAAILAGDLATAKAQAAIIANAETARALQGLEASAEFKIQALAILKTNQQQIDALTAKFGATGLIRVLGFFGGPGPGGPREFGGFGGPGGPGGPGGGGHGRGPGGNGFTPGRQ